MSNYTWHYTYHQTTPIRVDQFLVQYFGVNKTHAQRLIQNRLVFVNDQLVRKNGAFVECGQTVALISQTIPTASNPIPAFPCELDIIFEDHDLLVINKPSGILSHPTIHQETNTLVNMLAYHFNQTQHDTNLLRHGIAHRLDKQTSGLMLVAKTKQAFERLLQDFMEHKVIKKYYAIILHHLPKNHLEIHLPIGHSKHNSLLMVVDDGHNHKAKNPKPAHTTVKLVEKLHHHSLVECQLHTGRTHQIRVHLSYLKCPILNDPLYGHQHKHDLFGQYLHAYYLKFTHPITQQCLEFVVDWPQEFQHKYQELKYAKIQE